MKRQKSRGPHLDKLVHQLPGVVNFAYDLRFRCTIAFWKGLSEEYTCFLWRALHILIVTSPKNVVYDL
jgi:hypothetical protein